jgi:hypothetical protein
MEARTGETHQESDSKFAIYFKDEKLLVRITLPEKNQQIHLRFKKHRNNARKIKISVKFLPIGTKHVLSRSDPIDKT